MKLPLISRLFQPRASLKNSIFGNTYSFFFGSTTSGKTVDCAVALIMGTG